MRKITLILILLPFITFSQYRWDFGGNLGGTNYLGEMGGNAGKGRDFVYDMKMSKTRYIAGGFARYKYSQYLSFKGSINYVRISGADATSTNYGRRGRNLSFVNGIVDAEAIAQFFFYQINDVGGSYKYKNDIRFYVFGGGTEFYSNPKTSYEGKMVALRPLKTEGESKPYPLFNFGIPMGFGAYMTIQRIIRVGIEFTYVKTFTDYLDDVSKTYASPAVLQNPTAIALANRSAEYTSDPAYLAQYTPGSRRGDPKNKDTYMYAALTGSYVLKGKSAFYKAHYGSIFHKNKFKKRRVRAKF